MNVNYRLGIDAGGTFTDFVIADRSTGVTKLFKSLSTPANPTQAIEDGLKLISRDLGLSPEQIVSNCDLCINGTTVGLNALITHRGGKTGLICTAGHEDSIEIRNGHKEDGFRYDPEYPAAVMLAPRYLRRGVRDRVFPMAPFAPRYTRKMSSRRVNCSRARALRSRGDLLRMVGFESRRMQQRAAQIVRERLPEVILTVGSDLYPQIRIDTRTSTSVLNAYLAPVMRKYVASIDAYFKSLVPKQPCALFPIQWRAGDWPGDDRPFRLCDQFGARVGATGRPLCLRRAVRPEERHHHRHGRHLLRHYLDEGRSDQSQQEHRFPALSHRRADDPGRTLAAVADPLVGSTCRAFFRSGRSRPALNQDRPVTVKEEPSRRFRTPTSCWAI